MRNPLLFSALRAVPTRCAHIRNTLSKPHLPHNTRRTLLTLAIETSCDDTCVAILEKSGSTARLLFKKKITSDHSAFRGVHPKFAVLGHTQNLPPLVHEAIQSLPSTPTGGPQIPDFVTVTRGPGMPTNLAVGCDLAKGLALAWRVPLLGVHHMQAHALTPRLVSALERPWPSSPTPTSPTSPPTPPPHPAFPFLTLLVSGGHTQLLLSSSLASHSILANSTPLAIGNMLDHAARDIVPPSLLAQSASVSFGPLLEEFAFPGSTTSPSYTYPYSPPRYRRDEVRPYTSTRGWTLAPPMADNRIMGYNFSGFDTQVRTAAARLDALEALAYSDGAPEEEEEEEEEPLLEARRELARQTLTFAFEHLASRLIFALDGVEDGKGARAKWEAKGVYSQPGKKEAPEVKTLVLSGGVASNKFLRHVIRKVLDVRGYEEVNIVAPPVELCTDNAAMIAWAGMEMWEAGWESDMGKMTVMRKWGMDEKGEDGGVLGVGGENYKRRE